MPLTKVGIWNIALSHLGNTNSVVLDTDTTVEAQSCSAHWDVVLDEVLRAVAWPFATKIAALAGKAAAPNIEWAFSYTYPSDVVTIRRILDSVNRLSAERSQIPFRRTKDKVLTNVDNALAEYTERVTDPTQFPADFVDCVALLLASRIATAVAGVDGRKYKDDASKEYQLKVQVAAANAGAEERDRPEETSASGKPKEDICNLALTLLGVDTEIQNLGSEKSKEARAFRQVYDKARDQVLRDFDWPFARKYLALAGEAADPTPDWAFSYTYPADAVAVRRVLSALGGSRVETNATRIKFEIFNDATNPKVYTTEDAAVAIYTMRADDPTKYPADFSHALALMLAVKTATKILGVEIAAKTKAVERCLALYRKELTEAQINAATEEVPEVEGDSELERSRW